VKFDEIKRLMNYTPTDNPVQLQHLFQEQLRALGIDPTNLYQELEMSSDYVNAHRDISYSNAVISLHSHDYFEIIYCRTNTNTEYLIGPKRYRLQKGDIVCIPPGISHRPILPDQMKEPYVREVLWIKPAFLREYRHMFLDEPLMEHEWLAPLRTAGTHWEFLEDLFQRAVREEEEKHPGWEAAVIGNTLTILSHLNRLAIEQNSCPVKTEKPELLDRITAYIENNYTSCITIGDLAHQFYVSESTISHLFKQKMGISLYRYIIQRRLITAKLLIKEGKSMEDVCRHIGFKDYSTFYRAFKQEYGISPRQFNQLQNPF